MMVLASLSNSDKLDLIAKLSNSMREGADEKRMRPDLRTCFKGDWSDESVEGTGSCHTLYPSDIPTYDLQGRQLNAKPQKGIYIENGRKVVK